MSWYQIMDCKRSSPLILTLFLICISANYVACDQSMSKTANLVVDASAQYGRKIPDTLFGVFFEEINHAGAGGIWAELVNNRGFEAGGQNTPSNFHPWDIIGDKSVVSVSTERTSLFKRNPVALRIDVNCDGNECPSSGVGVYNPGYWGMNLEDGKEYKLTMYVKSQDSINMTASLTTEDGLMKLATTNILSSTATVVADWTKVQVVLAASGSTPTGRLQLTSKKRGTIWIDQVSLMPSDTYRGHGFRKDLVKMVEDLKPRFIRFPGGCFVEGDKLINAFRWTTSVGPWEERPGHFSDIWNYWTDDGLVMFNEKDKFNNVPRSGPKAFVSEYAVTDKNDLGEGKRGNFLGSLGEAGFLIGIEKNSDAVGMASYAPLFANINYLNWNPNAIIFNSSQVYGTPSYWMQHFFKNSSGAILNPISINPDMSATIATSAITYNNSDGNTTYLKIKIVNFGLDAVNFKIKVNGLQYSINAQDSSKTTMTYTDSVKDENSFSNPTKVVPVKKALTDASTEMNVQILPQSINSFDLALGKPISDPDN